MHLTRPKSSKGRSRPSVSQTPNVDGAASAHNTLPKPPSVGSGKLNRYTHSQSSLGHSNERRVDEVPDYLDNVPEVSSFPFPWNKYKPLPSIEKKTSDVGISLRCMEVKTSKLSLSDNLINQAQGEPREHQLTSVRTRAASQSNPEIGNTSEVLCEGFSYPNHLVHSVIATTQIAPLPTPGTTSPVSLLLAIRAPCGRRFEHHFLSTDTLFNVLASAEAKYGTRYQHGYIETLGGYIETGVDRPFRKTFTDLNMTLAQCGILNRSVLCIFQDIA